MKPTTEPHEGEKMQSITFEVSSTEVVAAIVNAISERAEKYREFAEQGRVLIGPGAIEAARNLEAVADDLDKAVKDAGW